MPSRAKRIAFARTVAVGTAALIPAGFLTGCTVPTAGVTGITVDDAGRPVIVFALCHDHIDGATTYRDRTADDPESIEPSVSVAHWKATAPVTAEAASTAAINTAQLSSSWTARGGAEEFRDGVEYSAYGWTRDNTWSTAAVTFTLDQLSTLEPGQILSQASSPDWADEVRTYEEFATASCDDRS